MQTSDRVPGSGRFVRPCRSRRINGARVISETLRILPASNILGTCTDSSVRDHQPRRGTGSPVGYYESQLPANRGPCTFRRHEILRCIVWTRSQAVCRVSRRHFTKNHVIRSHATRTRLFRVKNRKRNARRGESCKEIYISVLVPVFLSFISGKNV